MHGTYHSERTYSIGDLMSTSKIVLMVAFLCILLSGCIETHEYEWKDDTGKKQMITDIDNVELDHKIANFYVFDITLYDNKSVIMTGTLTSEDNAMWIYTGSGSGAELYALQNTDVDYLYLYPNQTAVAYTDDYEFMGEWK